MRREQDVADHSVQLADEGVDLPSRRFEEDSPRERIPVGVKSGRGQADQHVARHDRTPVDQLRFLNNADDEAGDVVLAVGVEARHLGRLSADERAPILPARARDAGDNLFRDNRRQPPGGEVIEKEERLCALDEDVVHAVVDEIGPDGVVASRHEGHLQFRSDAIDARDEHRILIPIAVETEQAAERADVREHARRERRSRERPDAADDFVAGVDVDAGVFVFHQRVRRAWLRRFVRNPMSL